MKGTITMSAKETERISILDRLMKKEIKQKHAAKLMSLSVRQARTLSKRYQREGAAGIIHKLRGAKGNRAVDAAVLAVSLETVKERYYDFGPTLAHEKLLAFHAFPYSRETLRRAMIAAGIRKERKRKQITLHQLRERRDCLGELVQADGSPHDWFEGRGPTCTLLVFIDDATGKLLWLQFVESESTMSYFSALEHYLNRHGRPMILYVDKHSIFRVNTTKGQSADTTDSNGLTQFGRTMEELSIDVIFANSAEAKGRVERANLTLQDRLVKEMRLLGISAMEQGNAYLPTFMEQFNKKFAVVPKSPVNMHRPLLPNQNLDTILCLKYTRILSRQLTISYENRIYQIQTERPVYAMRHARVEVREARDGTITIRYKGQILSYTIVKQQPKTAIVDSKHLNAAVDRLSQQIGIPITLVDTPWTPPKDHPWRQFRITI